MRIVAARAWRVQLALSTPYSIAYETYDHANICFVRLETEHGAVGSGSASPAPEVTGESIDATQAALDTAAAELLRADADNRVDLLERLHPVLNGHPAARAAIEMALYDLAAKQAGEPLCRFLGGRRRRLPTSVTIGICSLQETRQQAQEWVARGFGALKIKGGRGVDADVERIHALRADLGDQIALRFDANQGYSIEETLRFTRATSTAGIELIEQPVAADPPTTLLQLGARLAELASTAPGSHPPLMADESLVSVEDAVRLAAAGAVDAFNIKLMKAGGLGPARAIAAVAESFSIGVMLSCMDEAALSIAAALHLALATPSVRWIDLDGHLDLVDDPTAAAVELADGHLSVRDVPGLGADLSG